jgi:peptidoglycan/xylan/chitin deacetylase (PgdA/CDA1 family)
MNKKLESYIKRHVAKFEDTRLVFCVLSCVAGLGLLLVGATPVVGRWDVPQTVESATGDYASLDPDTNESPLATPTPVVLPEQAQVPILMYHYVSPLPPDPDRYRLDLTVLPENFEAQLQYLAQAGYHAITLSDLYMHFTQGYPLPDKPIVLTFDDGYVDAYEVVFPLLLDYGFTGTFFVLATPAHFESPGYLTWAQMKEMSDAGMEIQAHGRDHVDLRGRSNDFLVYQTLGIQEAIHDHTGKLPRFFCYPSGRYDANVISVLKSAGYWGAVTTEWGQTHTLENFFVMPRIRISGGDTLDRFISKLD